MNGSSNWKTILWKEYECPSPGLSFLGHWEGRPIICLKGWECCPNAVMIGPCLPPPPFPIHCSMIELQLGPALLPSFPSRGTGRQQDVGPVVCPVFSHDVVTGMSWDGSFTYFLSFCLGSKSTKNQTKDVKSGLCAYVLYIGPYQVNYYSFDLNYEARIVFNKSVGCFDHKESQKK